MLARALSFRTVAKPQGPNGRRTSRKASPTSLRKYSTDEDGAEETTIERVHKLDLMPSGKSELTANISERNHKKIMQGTLHSTKETIFVILASGIAVILAVKAIGQGIKCQAYECTRVFVAFVYIFLAVALLMIVAGAILLFLIARAQLQWAQLAVLKGSSATRLLQTFGPAIDAWCMATFWLFSAMLIFQLILSHSAGLCDAHSQEAFASMCLDPPLGGGFYFVAPVLAQAVIHNLPILHILVSLAALFVTTVATANDLMAGPAFRSAFFQWLFTVVALGTCSLSMHAAAIESFSLYMSAMKKTRLMAQCDEKLQNEVFNHKIDLALVYEILPPEVVDCLREGVRPEAKRFDIVTVFFSDIVGFTDISSKCEETKVMEMLNDLYTVMDYVTSVFDLYKVETIGDAYMVTGGIKEDQMGGSTHAKLVASFAVIVRQVVAALIRNPVDGEPVRIRIGLHSGPTVAGVVGSLMPRCK